LEIICIGKDFLNRTPEAQQLRESVDKWDFRKLKSFCTKKEMVSKLKRPPTEWKKVLASYISDKELITRIYRELKKVNCPQIFTISGHKGNSNQNHTKIPPHSC
jgi:hypothetical protein